MSQGDEEEVLEAGHIFIQTLLLFATVICKCKLSRVQLQDAGMCQCSSSADRVCSVSWKNSIVLCVGDSKLCTTCKVQSAVESLECALFNVQNNAVGTICTV